MRIAELWIKVDRGSGKTWRKAKVPLGGKGLFDPFFAMRNTGRRRKTAELKGGLSRYTRGNERPYSSQPQSAA